MRPSEYVGCDGFPCRDVRHEAYRIPEVDLKPETISLLMIAEVASGKTCDYFYAGKDALFAQTTVQAFRDAGVPVSSVEEILDLGIYLTTAVKCGKTGYGIRTDTINQCSRILEKELAFFPNATGLMLMGDVAIQAINAIARRAGQKRAIPAGSTYKIRGAEYTFFGKRAFPSYLQAGPSFFIEKSKRRMIAEDIAAALRFVEQNHPRHDVSV
jgi:uracil-DNA glycosylase